MRLLKVDSQGQLSLTKNLSKDIPSYAILSHTWSIDEEDEVTLSDLKDGSGRNKPGFAKILSCAKQAHKDGLEYFWVDTCCIDKTGTVELGEAICSMYKWYRGASKCYVFLSDVPPGDNTSDPGSKFFCSRWFRRGWTLQELLAPSEIQFYDQSWQFIGTKMEMSGAIEAVTGIPQRFLRTMPVDEASVAQRMSWAAKRETTREEDMAYCLLGIFNANMPVLYGEGLERAFIRLQEEIMNTTRDDSIFAWGFGHTKSRPSQLTDVVSAGVFATAPSNFADCGHIVPRTAKPANKFDISRGLLLGADISLHATSTGEMYGMLNCGPEQNTEQLVGIPLSKATSGTSADEYLRPQGRHPVILAETVSARFAKAIYIMKRQTTAREAPSQQYWFHVEENSIVTLTETYPPSDWEKNSAMIVEASESNKNITRKCLARFRSQGEDFRDFVLVLELEIQGLKAHSHVMTLSKDSSLEELWQKLGYMRPEAFGKRSASNGKVNIEVSVLKKYGPRFVVKLVRPSNTTKVTVDANWELKHVDRKLEFVRMLQQEDQIRFEAEQLARQKDEKRTTLDTMRERLIAVKKNLKSLEEEQRSLEDELDKGDQDMKHLTERYEVASKKQDSLFGREMEIQRDLDKHETKYGLHNWLETTIKTQLATGEIQLHSKDTGVSDADDTEISRVVEIENNIDSHMPLIWAAENGHEAVIRLLLEKGADIEAKHNGQTLLMIAAEKGHETVVRLLLEKGADIEAKNNGQTLLMIAAENGHEAVMRLLLEKGADIEAENSGQTLLVIAVENGHEAIIQLLLDKGADIKATHNSQILLMAAVKNGHKAIVQLLLEKGANIDSKDDHGQTPLMVAVEQEHKTVVQLLLEKEADIDADCGYGRTLLAWAIEKGHDAVVWQMLKKGTKTELRFENDHTLLMCAADCGQRAVAQLLLEKGADIKAHNYEGQTSLLLAAANGHEAVVQLLLKKGADIQATNRNGWTSLMVAAEQGHEAVVRLLLERGAEIEPQNKYNRTSLMAAAANGHDAVVQLLLKKGANIEAKDNNGWTSLMFAVQNGHKAVVQLVLEKGADIKAENNWGKTSLKIATEEDQQATMMLLLSAAEQGHKISASA